MLVMPNNSHRYNQTVLGLGRMYGRYLYWPMVIVFLCMDSGVGVFCVSDVVESCAVNSEANLVKDKTARTMPSLDLSRHMN